MNSYFIEPTNGYTSDFPSTLLAKINLTTLPSPFNDEHVLSDFLADYNRLYQTTSRMFIPAGDWFWQKGYIADDLENGHQRVSVQIDFEPDIKQVQQYRTLFSAIRSGKPIELLTIEYDPVTKAIILAGSDGQKQVD